MSFVVPPELESELEAAGKTALLDFVRNVIPKTVTCIYIRQSAPLGLGHAVLCARPVIGDDPFAVLGPHADPAGLVSARYDAEPGTAYLLRPDGYVAARFRHPSRAALDAALSRASGHN